MLNQSLHKSAISLAVDIKIKITAAPHSPSAL